MIERANRTVRAYLIRAADALGTEKWIDNIASIIDLYNDTRHSTIEMTPNEAESDFATARFNRKRLREHQGRKYLPLVKVFSLGDIVRLKIFTSGV